MADIFVVNSVINDGKVYILEDPSMGPNMKSKENNFGILSMLFVGDVKQDASAEISMIYTSPNRRRQGKPRLSFFVLL